MPVIIIIAVGALIVFSIFMSMARQDEAQDRVEQWAKENGYDIVSRQRRTLLRGPFSITTSKSQEVYEITVRDQEGKTRDGYVRVGGGRDDVRQLRGAMEG